MSNVIEHLFCAYCSKECSSFVEEQAVCQVCDIWLKVRSMSTDAIRESMCLAYEELKQWQEDPYSGPLTKEDQDAYDTLLVRIELLEEVYSSRQECEECEECNLCSVCKTDIATMESLCADCFWEDDYNTKRRIRETPDWRFNRIINAGMVIMGRTKEEAIAVAVDIFTKEGLAIPV